MSDQGFVLDLSKTFELNLSKAGVTKIPVLRTRAAIDRSGSMRYNFNQGFVQRAVDLFIAAALKFDDNGELEIGFFNNDFHETEVAVLADAGVYMRTKGRKIDASGGTRFDPIIAWTLEEDTREEDTRGFFGKLFGKKQEKSLPDCGQYTGIVTDGRLESSNAVDAFEDALAKTSLNDFYQFIGIGDDVDATYLRNVAARYKNVEFIHIENPLQFQDNDFYKELCNPKFVKWIDSYNISRGNQ